MLCAARSYQDPRRELVQLAGDAESFGGVVGRGKAQRLVADPGNVDRSPRDPRSEIAMQEPRPMPIAIGEHFDKEPVVERPVVADRDTGPVRIPTVSGLAFAIASQIAERRRAPFDSIPREATRAAVLVTERDAR